ncbi:hypothetical protein CVT26_014743 [Gymnopilus dilepis]|uniref:Uncharacterized protein n=1 Tax=Gymnopilus dilepis TaxID=231916 RepID=A0A409W3L9_9AGAR|nr:hypothetical protein CVT26_014743 [Gymnopilus dilepis]
MPDDAKKPVTRSSIRQSLNLASVGKVFADAIGKDSKDTKKSSRRSSALPAAPRASMGDVRPPSQVSRRTATPEAKTVTRRRVSTVNGRSSSDEQPPKPTDATSPNTIVPSKPSALRPKNPNGTSALPKYRPKSAVAEPAKPPSPVSVRAGTRRRLSSSTSDEEKKEQKRPDTAPAPPAPAEKMRRPISPLPQRAALKASNVANSLDNRTPPTTPSSKPRLTTPVKSSSSPSRPAKIVKTNPSTSIPRPPSSSSSSLSLQQPTNVTPKSSPTPKTTTPKSTGIKAKLGLSRSAHGKSRSESSVYNERDSSPSPLTARHSRKTSKLASSSSSAKSANMSHISERTSEEEDSDAEDVALLLAPVAAIGAPTPAMPRIQPKKRTAPQTPTRSNLPTREKMSYLSPLPPGSSDKSSSSSFLRPPAQQQTATERAMRGSIMSWEQLANDTSITLGEDEFGRMLSDVPAPFRSTPASPTLSSTLEIPESPLLTAMDSPGGYGSISQVLLPDVTPSPSMHQGLQAKFALTPDVGIVDSSTVTMLRLQLAAAENTSKERLYQIQAMEEELYHLKQAHAHQLEEAQKQIAYMESQSSSHSRSGTDDTASSASIAHLEEQLRQAHISHSQALADAIRQCEDEARASHRRESLRCETMTLAGVALSSWGMVRDACEVEIDAVRNDKAVLGVLLGQLDQLAAVL